MQQVEMVSLEELIPLEHSYRKFKAIWTFKSVEKELKRREKDNPYKGYGLLRLFKCLLLQFMEDLSDRELSRYIQENTAAKWFCNFSLLEKTPDYSVFSKFRTRLGTHRLSKIFSELRAQLKYSGSRNSDQKKRKLRYNPLSRLRIYMSTKRNKYTAAEKSKIALEAIKGELTLSQITAKYGVHATQITAWKKQLLAYLPEAFTETKKREKTEYEAQIGELYEQIGRLKIENDFLKCL